MKTNKCLGIWMDYSKAHLMQLLPGDIHTQIIESNFTHEEKASSIEKSEKHMHNKEEGEHLKYFKKIQKEIEKYDDVLLFGPTDAKEELNKLLHEDHINTRVRIEIKTTDKMTENQLHAFVRKHFNEKLRLNLV
jgi:stalled ribosome rescue protein Dom34